MILTMDVFILEGIRTITFLYCIQILFRGVGKKGHISFMISCVIICTMFLLLKCRRELLPLQRLLIELGILLLYIKIYYRKKTGWIFFHTFFLYVLWDLLYMAAILFAYPIVLLTGIKQKSVFEGIVLICGQLLFDLAALFYFRRNPWKLPAQVSWIAKAGIVLVCVQLEFAMLWFRTIPYHAEDMQSYGILLTGILFGCILLALWIADKRNTEKKVQEITSYAHRMREVIPSVGRVLYRLKEVPEYAEISEQIVEELRSIYQTDREETQRKNRSIKTFASTGCIVLDEQLERYLEEACEHKFTLDVIVRAPVNEILTRKWVDRYHLLQLVGDLYRNAYRAILKRREGGDILFCFGYNREGFYEISIYDNGEKFPEYIIKHLGERGVTTGGTGQGLADIFEVLKRSRASFVLN